jgi:hypothetical protein
MHVVDTDIEIMTAVLDGSDPQAWAAGRLSFNRIGKVVSVAADHG